MAKKYICDICGEECTDETFLLPVIAKYNTVDLNYKIISLSRLTSYQANLCDDCCKQIIGYVRLLTEIKNKRSKTNE